MEGFLRTILICSFFSLQAMDVVENPGAKFLKKIEVFNNQELVNAGRKWNESVPQGLFITPGEKGILLSMPGRVVYGDMRTMQRSKLHELIRHSHTKYCPMIAAAMTKNGLRVVSVLNNISDNVSEAECIISRNQVSSHPDHKSHNIFKKSLREDRKLDAPAQAIALSADGDIIAIAFKDYIGIIDLLTGTYRKSNFMPNPQGALITAVSAPVDMEFLPNEKHLAAVSTDGVIDVKKISNTEEDGITFTHFKDIKTGEESIEKIYLSAQQLLYVTEKCKVKIIDIKDLIEHGYGAVKTRTVTHCQQCKIAVDANFNNKTPLGTIQWNDGKDMNEDKRYKLTIRREHGTAAEKIVISLFNLPHLEKKYNSITEMGREVLGVTHVLLAALRGDCVVALLTDGSLYAWQLPEKHQVQTEEEVTRLSQVECYKERAIRRRSSSDPLDKNKQEKRKSEKGGLKGFGSFVSSGGSKEGIKQTPRDKRTRKKESPEYAAALNADALQDLVQELKDI